MRHQQYTAPEVSTFHLDETAYTLLNTSPTKHINDANDVDLIGNTVEDDAHKACAKEFMFLDADDFDDWE